MAVPLLLDLACASVDFDAPLGPWAVALAVATWCVGCFPPRVVISGAILVGAGVFLPLAALVGIAAAANGASMSIALHELVAVLSRGLPMVLVALCTASVLSPSELQEGLAALPLPRFSRLLLVQLVQQTFSLLEESRRIGAALALRSGAAQGGANAVFLRTIPTVWLPRVLGRADRLAQAMELRRYDHAVIFSPVTLGARDRLVLLLASAPAAVVFGERLWRSA